MYEQPKTPTRARYCWCERYPLNKTPPAPSLVCQRRSKIDPLGAAWVLTWIPATVATLTSSGCHSEDLRRCLPAVSFAWPVVELGFDSGEIEGAKGPEVCVLPEVLADQTVGVSLVPLIHGQPGSAKKTPSLNSAATRSWRAISLP